MSGAAQGSFSDPHAIVNNASPTMSDVRKASNGRNSRGGNSYVELLARKSAARQKGFYFDPVPDNKVSVLQRPVWAPSKKNVEDLDKAHERDIASFERRANVYRRLANAPFHHNRAADSIVTLWEQGHIADRGKHHPASAPEDHMLGGVQRPDRYAIPHEQVVAQKHGRWLVRCMHDATRLAHIWNACSAPLGQPEVPVAPHANRRHAARNPITGDNTDVSLHDAPCGRACVRQQAAHNPILGRSNDMKTAVPAACSWQTTTKKLAQSVRAGDSWGSYNPILHTWDVPPKDKRFHDQEAVSNRRAGVGGMSRGRATPGRDQGVYNPILNQWVVPPENARLVHGLAFAPASLFSESQKAKHT
eukprot:364500-Chlamydomonas_euryale.AAC.40